MDLLGPKFAQIYGQGEVPMTITALSKAMHADRSRPRWREIMGSVGLPRVNVEVRVADDEDRELPVGEIGEVLVRGEVVMKGYWSNPAGNRGNPARRLAAHRRHGRVRRGRLPHAQGPLQGHDHQRRQQHLPA